MCATNKSGLIGLKTATFFLRGNRTKSIDMVPIHDHVKNKNIVGISLPIATASNDGIPLDTSDSIYLDLLDSGQNFVNTKLPGKTIRQYENIGRFYPIAENISFQYSRINTSVDSDTTKCIAVTVHFD